MSQKPSILTESGVFSTSTHNARAISEQYWRERIAQEITIAHDLEEAKSIVLNGLPTKEVI